MNKNHLQNLLLSDKTPIVLLIIFKGEKLYRGVAFIVRQKGKRVWIATNRHHFTASTGSAEKWKYFRGEKKYEELQFCKIYYAASELEDYCIIELKSKNIFRTKMIPLKVLNEKELSSISQLVTIRNTFIGFGGGIEILSQSGCSYRKEMKAIVHNNNYQSILYNLRNGDDSDKYQALTQEHKCRELIVFNAISIPGVSGSPVIVQNGFNEYISIGINQGGTKGSDLGDFAFYVPAWNVIKLLESIP